MNGSSPRPEVIANIQTDNDRVRVTEYVFSPGAETTWHQHQWDYVVVPQTDGLLLIVARDNEESYVTLTRGISYYREAGVEHNVINYGKEELVFIEIEIKAHPISHKRGD
tara:strand:+ start:240 stop:569 length:330 start_codon:yes stop_codon:yes gene_type:complete